MAREKRLQNAVEILNKRNEEFRANRKRNLYDFKVNEEDLNITIHGIIFFEEIKKMNYLYISSNGNHETQIQF